jgi:hypothetical protein
MRLQNLLLEGIPACLQIALIGIFLKRKLYLRFPWFFGYTIFSIAATVARHALGQDQSAYYWLYWITEIIFGILALFSLREVFGVASDVFYFGGPLLKFVPTTAVLLVVSNAVWQAIYNPPKHYPGYEANARLQAGAYAFVFGIRCLETAICFLCLRLGWMKGSQVKWGQYDYGILVGFGLSGLLTSLVFLARFVFGQNLEGLFRYAPSGVYIIVTMTWFDAFRRKEPPFTKKPPTLEDITRKLDWFTQSNKHLDALDNSPTVHKPKD